MYVAIIAALSVPLLFAGSAVGQVDDGRAVPPWPPERTLDEVLGRQPMPVPWLESPPAVIILGEGRQLFVDDYLIAETDLTREFHKPLPHAGNPLVRPDRPWEQQVDTLNDPRETIAFSDGVWFDPSRRRFLMWYESGRQRTCYAESLDGIHWEKPLLDVRPGTNIVKEGKRDSTTIWLDLSAADPARRFKMMRCRRDVHPGYTHAFAVSPDGIHWHDALPPFVAPKSDRSTFFYNPFREKWVFSVKDVQGDPPTRYRRYYESEEFPPPDGANANTVPWVGADGLDAPREGIGVPPQLYCLDATPYESLLLGLFVIWQGNPPNYPARQKINQVFVGFSRDGFHWHRPLREPFIPVSEDPEAWNYGNVQSVGGCCLVIGEQLYFYASGRMTRDVTAHEGFSSTGLFTLRRDGFASMNAGARGGSLTTPPLRLEAAHLFVNVAAPDGALRVEILDVDGKPIEPFTAARCEVVTGDSTIAPVRWAEAPSLDSLAAGPVRLRFHLRNGKLYAFWLSPSSSGASRGYVAAGGPGFTGPRDTTGRHAYEAVAHGPTE
ncbi:MAG: glycosyl hydrolase family 32 [Candidatus Hydrogenedentes bacterium]|nr:glycosyl hydrolase family 32 [Candidatus Hydrogenedentota bacterium]